MPAWLRWCTVLGFLMSGVAFADSTAFRLPSAVNTECRLPKDQGRGSLHGQWDRLPIGLVFDSTFYTENNGRDAKAMLKAVRTWNSWAAAKGLVLFVMANEGKGMDIPELTDCAQASYTDAVRPVVGVWKIYGDGPHRNRRESCGTNADGTPGKILPLGVQASTDWRMEGGKIHGASVLLNFEDFNAPGKQKIDVESLLLHELGHVLGLLHSCNGSGAGGADSTTAPACFLSGTIAVPGDYLNAAMFPFLQVGEKKRKLGTNDIGRANCLY